MNIIWTKTATTDYWQNIDYLVKDWDEKIATDFIEKVEQVIYLISCNPNTFPKTNYKNIRYICIVPQITLYYQFKNDSIYLIRFWNNFQNPDKLKL